MTDHEKLKAANDAGPAQVFSLTTAEDFVEWEPSPETLRGYALDTCDGRKAFLYQLYWIGYPALLVGADHVWSLLIAPRAYRCTLMGQLSGAGGGGRQALVNMLRQFIAEALATIQPIPALDGFASLEAFNDAVQAGHEAGERDLQQVIARYEKLLNGENPGPCLSPHGMHIGGPTYDHAPPPSP